MPDRVLLVRILLDPGMAEDLPLSAWDLLVRQGRAANLLAELAFRLDALGKLNTVPDAPRNHLYSAIKEVEQQRRVISWEVHCIRSALSRLDVPVVLLKGAAYLFAGLPMARGRSFSDVDVLVPKEDIGRVENELLIHGWIGAHLDSYDQKYYREWMHEIPPMSHPRRFTAIDVHHSILPETARVKVRSALLFDRLQEMPDETGCVCTLHPVDMLLHSATHLFHEGELEKGLRDLFDLDGLMRHFGGDDFWALLAPRASELGLSRPLYYAIRYTSRLIETPVPSAVQKSADIGRPSAPVLWVMDFCYLRALRPAHKNCDVVMTSFARFLLYLRSHWIRMPIHLLLPHLLRKAFRKSDTAVG